MEYIQTVLFQVPASLIQRASQPGGLLSEIDEHRGFLKQQPGFRDLRVTRSINNEGNVLVVVQTRWSDEAGLLRYETGEPNAASIVRRHESVLVPNSLQVLDMEALRTEASWAPAEAAAAARQQFLMPIILPLGVLAFALLVIYGLSRVYLELPNEAAVALAAGIAIGILLVAAYLAFNPRVPAWQIGGIFVVVGAVLVGGTIWALTQEDAAEGGEVVNGETPAPSPDGEEPVGETVIMMGDNFFVFEGERNPAITISAGQEVTFDVVNEGAAIHNVHVAGADGAYAEAFCTVGGPAPCSDPNLMSGGQTGTITMNLEAGSYPFRCDFHPQEMVGTIVAE